MKKMYKYGIIGGLIGGAVSLATAPARLAFALTAPASYPLIGVSSAMFSFSNMPGCDEIPLIVRTVAVPVIGELLGTAAIPFAPVVVLGEIFQVPAGTIMGAALGGYIGYRHDQGDTTAELLEELKDIFPG